VPDSLSPSRAIRLTSLLTWVVVGASVFAKHASQRNVFTDHCAWVWMVGFATGILASVLSWRRGAEHRRVVLGLLAAATVSILFVNRWWPSHLGGLPLVFVAWEAAQVLSLRNAALWAAAQSLIFALLMVPFPGNHPRFDIPLPVWLSNTLVLAGLQAFAILVAHLMRRQAATRELLVHASRAEERLRIARELHDVIGHHLAALSLNLEVAGLELQKAERPHALGLPIEKARTLTRTMLAEVRQVVSRMRADEATDLAAALRELVAPIPSPRIHLQLPERLPPVDPARAITMLRCAQECVTNAIRHSSAENLWIELDASGGGLGLRVRDDGTGAPGLAEGHGISGMRERLAALSGRLRVNPGPPGFEAEAWVP
jgi:signal transduction histidine kinase